MTEDNQVLENTESSPTVDSTVTEQNTTNSMTAMEEMVGSPFAAIEENSSTQITAMEEMVGSPFADISNFTVPEAAQNPSEFLASFDIKIRNIYTIDTETMKNVVKKVDWTMIGSYNDNQAELHKSTELNFPDENYFIQLENLTESDVINFIKATDNRIPAFKSRIQSMLNEKDAKLKPSNLPWLSSPISNSFPDAVSEVESQTAQEN